MLLRSIACLATITLFASLAGCSEDGGGTTPTRDTGTNPGRDAGTDGGDTEDTGPIIVPDGGPNPIDGGEMMTECNNPPLMPPANGTCSVTPGNGTNRAILIRAGNIMVPTGVLENGQVLIAASGEIACAACDCTTNPEATGAIEISCANGFVSPALINAHDHITFTEAPPAPHGTERFEHRHDWRRGQNGHTRIPSTGNMGGDNGIWWGELRNLMAGTLSINGSGGAGGLVRNLDQPSDLQDGLNKPRVRYSTFPLRDTDGVRLENGCNYGDTADAPTDTNIVSASAYAPHISEGIDVSARNEFLCLSSDAINAGHDIIFNKTAVIHGIGLLATDFAAMAADHSSLIWSPRSNIDLYGNTAQVVLAAQSGVRIAIGTDWAISGSMNMLRELRCAAGLNSENYGGFFTDRQLLDMATVHAAGALGFGDLLGALAPTYVADITIWNAAINTDYRAILDAKPEDVVLVLRGGDAMYGDQAVMSALPDTAAECEMVDVCSSPKLVCAARETGATIAMMQAQIAANSYALFFCGDPPDEPSCVPFRMGEYLGMSTAGDGDGDGVMDMLDNCPTVFNPVRPLDTNNDQADVDNDGDGDACDVCPTQPMATMCAPPNPNDRDGDMIDDGMDNCPTIANMGQEDRDMDNIGDLCDACPDVANPGMQGCPATIYDVKRGLVTGPVFVENVVVTAVGRSGFFVQIVPGDPAYDMTLGERYSGSFVFVGTAAMKPLVGDRVDLSGRANEFFGERQIDASAAMMGSVTVLSSNNALPDPIVVMPAEIATDPITGTHGARAEELEGVLVEVRDVMVTDIAPAPGTETPPINEFVVNGSLRVNDYLYLTAPFPAVGDQLVYVRGIGHFNFENYKLEPRSSEDVGTRERLVAVDPTDVLVPSGFIGVPPGGFAVVMNRPVSTAIVVNLMSSVPGEIDVPASVTVDVGQVRADIPVTVSSTATEATIFASYDGVTVSGTVLVYEEAGPRRVVLLQLNQTTLAPSGMTAGSFALDLPAPLATGSTVTFAVSPPSLATVSPSEIFVPGGAAGGVFTLTAGTSTGAGSLAAFVDGSTTAVSFNVVIVSSRPPAPGDLLITEVFRNPDGANEREREWFEVYNTTTDDIELGGLTIADLANSYMVPPGAVIPAGGYGIFASLSDPARNGGINNVTVAYDSSGLALNNASETITLTYGGMTIEELGIGAGWPGGAQNVAMCLRAPYPMDNSMMASWTNSVGTFGTGGTGSPGIGSDATNCP